MNYSNTISAAAADVERKISALLPLLDQLERALLTEAQALASRDAQALLSAVETKRRSLRDLEKAFAETGLMAMLDTLSAEHANEAQAGSPQREPRSNPTLKRGLLAAAVPSWQRLTEHLTRCRSLNQAAGGATAAMQRHTDHGLRQLGLSQEPCVYGLSGRTQAQLSALKSVVA